MRYTAGEASDVLQRLMVVPVLVNQQELTYNSCVWTQDVVC